MNHGAGPTQLEKLLSALVPLVPPEFFNINLTPCRKFNQEMISEFGKLRSWALLIAILVCGPLFPLLFFESNVNLRRISYDISASPNSKLKGERDSEHGEQKYVVHERFDQIQKEDRFVKSDIMDTPRGPDGFEESRDEESLKAFKAWQEEQAEFKAWQEEQMRRRSLVDKACATKTRKGAGKKKGKTNSLFNVVIIHEIHLVFVFCLLFDDLPLSYFKYPK